MRDPAMRTCIATNVKKPKNELIRLVRVGNAEQGYEVKVDTRGKQPGRGANLDQTPEAFELAVKKGAIERALKLERKLSISEIEVLRQQFAEATSEKQFRKGQKHIVIKVSKAELDQKLAGS